MQKARLKEGRDSTIVSVLKVAETDEAMTSQLNFLCMI